MSSDCYNAFLLQDLMKGAPDTPNVVEACNLEGRQERLDGLLSQLEMCEKALQVSSLSFACSLQLRPMLLLLDSVCVLSVQYIQHASANWQT